MVEWESQQASPILTQPQDVMSAAGLNYIYDLASSVAERWLTTDITSLHQEANTIQNSFLNTEHNVHNELSVRCIVQNATVLNEENIHVPPNILNIPNSSLMDINNSNNFYDSMDVNTDITLPIDEYVETGTLSLWGSPMDLDHLKMDDVFQVDKADLFQGPTLAELNANDESLFDSLDSFDQCLPSDNKEAQTVKSSKSHTVTLSSSSAFLSDLNYSDCDLKITHSSSKSFSVKVESQYAKDTVQIEKSPALPLFVSSSESETNSKFNKDVSAPIVENFESNIHEAKCRPVVSESADYQTYLTNKNPAVVAGKERHLKTEETKNDESHIDQINDFECENPCNLSSLSNDEGFDSQDENSDNDYLFSSEGESGDEMGEDISHNWSAAGDKWVGNKKKTRYFWQYNIQSKGPKGPKVKLSKNSPNPHCITDVGDPVFSTVCRVEGVKHAGKARRGDGNDLTPNPRKLYNIGMELQKLSSVINDLTPVNELPFNARPKSRKEKNKLASRACRLKKKAQHEANKLKFFGLQQEQRSLLGVLTETKKIVKIKLQDIRSQEESCEEKMETLLSKKDFTKVAGSSAEFVNKVLDKVASGDPNGGLSRLQVL